MCGENQIERTKAVYSELAIARGLCHYYLHFDKDSKQAEEWESFTVDEREGFRHPDGRLLARGNCRWAS